jgi:plasmid stabilization system protein ParE
MKRYVLTPSAKRDINDIWSYIANDNIDAADSSGCFGIGDELAK